MILEFEFKNSKPRRGDMGFARFRGEKVDGQRPVSGIERYAGACVSFPF